jgi:hypothetical protein
VVADAADVELETLVDDSVDVVAALVASVAATVVLAVVTVVAAPAVSSGGVSSGEAPFTGFDFPNGFKSLMPFFMSPPRPFPTAPTSEASPAISEAGIFGTTAFPNDARNFLRRGSLPCSRSRCRSRGNRTGIGVQVRKNLGEKSKPYSRQLVRLLLRRFVLRLHQAKF